MLPNDTEFIKVPSSALSTEGLLEGNDNTSNTVPEIKGWVRQKLLTVYTKLAATRRGELSSITHFYYFLIFNETVLLIYGILARDGGDIGI